MLKGMDVQTHPLSPHAWVTLPVRIVNRVPEAYELVV